MEWRYHESFLSEVAWKGERQAQGTVNSSIGHRA